MKQQSPKHIYRRCIAFEEQAAELYLRFASRFTGNKPLAKFWFEMAMEEKQHAGMLQFCLCEHMFSEELPGAASIQRLADVFRRASAKAAKADLGVKEAFEIAIGVESSEIDAIYSRLTLPLHKSSYLLRREIETGVPRHLGKLIAAARKFGVSESMLAKCKTQD